jgi:SAM-dependent methyltransferase
MAAVAPIWLSGAPGAGRTQEGTMTTVTQTRVAETPVAPVDTPAEPVETAAELVGRIFAAGVAAADLFTIQLGLELGLYRALDEQGPADSATLAARTGLAERYVREWLQGQTTTGLTTADGPDVRTARFALADGVREVLLDPQVPTHLAPIAACIATVGAVLPRVADAFRTGGGVPYRDYPQGHVIQAALNRPAYEHDLVSTWLPAMPDVAARLADTAHPVHVGDLGCGAGWSSIALATAYPHITVEGIDNDEASIELARANAREHGVDDRVAFTVADLGADGASGEGRYDLIVVFECLHDLPRPVEALANARRWLRPGGAVIVMDENAAESLTSPGDEVERFFAQCSVLWCLPQGMVGPDPEPAGTLLRPDTMRALAARAGFADVTVLDIEHPFWRFYRLHP